MNPIIWLLMLPVRLVVALVKALGYLLGIGLGVVLLGGGTALTLTGEGAILGVPAMVIGFLVLRQLLDVTPRPANPHPYPQPAAPPPTPDYHAYTPHYSRHYRRRPCYYWVPGRWTLR